MSSMTFIINDKAASGSAKPTIQVTITELRDGRVRFDIVQLVDACGDYVGDLRGFSFDIKESSVSASTLSVSEFEAFAADGTVISAPTEVLTGNDSVSNLGDGASMGTLLSSGDGDGSRYDFGIEIGTSSSAAGNDIRSASFTLSTTDLGGLTLADFIDQDFGIRLTSVGKVVTYDPTTGDYTLGSRTGTATHKRGKGDVSTNARISA
jgi:hypothetical protein